MLATQFRDIFSALAAGVSVITFDAGGHVHGFTATSLTPVSMMPPLALFCVARSSRSGASLSHGKMIGISILGEAQTHVSRRFSEQAELGSYQDITVRHNEDGVPVVSGANATIEARIANIYPAGDHLICVCELKSGCLRQADEPLLYFSRRYHGVSVLPELEAERAVAPEKEEAEEAAVCGDSDRYVQGRRSC
ncbi:conserved protein of DIM6/NTAB family [Burkholderia sp. Ch1-1]|uniref:Flavin reductase like domain-containing protein n=1 Tax=Paraburkholderia dioscoreae TaxID=2604047 RepID=A0A5Q4YSB9_9BURK|nr:MULTISPECIES: flavin reductase family protein [Paraburkholderia]EIF29091.1 conserved protein of DIM6/NTAB family [Burkholderia sp. Ch1-1]MDR8399500.1 flavin reductase family protein [Paraburkholderia sp. USG1]VVD26501.1 conserved protein of unknown function [Paraburkholderia dioscoreae]